MTVAFGLDRLLVGGEGYSIWEAIDRGRSLRCVCVEADILGFQVARLHSLGRHFGEHLETSTGCLEKTAGARSWGNISCQCEVNSHW